MSDVWLLSKHGYVLASRDRGSAEHRVPNAEHVTPVGEIFACAAMIALELLSSPCEHHYVKRALT